MTARWKDRALATALAALGGTVGAHRFYLEGASRIRPWMYPAFAWTLVPTFAGFVEALVYAVTDDARWDARWNPGLRRAGPTGVLPIVIAVPTFLGAMVLLMTMISFAAGRWYGAGETFW